MPCCTTPALRRRRAHSSSGWRLRRRSRSPSGTTSTERSTRRTSRWRDFPCSCRSSWPTVRCRPADPHVAGAVVAHRRRMTRFGYHASHEQYPPSALLEYVRLAEEVGFEGVLSADHFHPWLEENGHSGAGWSWLGAAMQATSGEYITVNA